ncbi:MAG: biopolymer transporter ExbD [Firmicutes bacterium]|nr:biopolymer transporter ExbD [Bacillota bacterium]
MLRPPKPDMESISAINLTSLVDILMVLIIMFLMMETSGASNWGFNMKLPTVVAVEKPKDPTVLISMSAEKKLFVTTSAEGDKLLQKDALKAEIARLRKEYGYKIVVIKADKKLKYNDIVGIMDDAKRAGYENISLATGL